MTVLGALTRNETRAVQATPWGDWGDSSGTTWAGASVTTSSSLQLLTVYGCVRFISDGISTLPVDTFTDRGDGGKIETEKPRWLTNPTPDLDFVAWCGQTLTSDLLAGNAYHFKVYRAGVLQELIPLDPAKVQVLRVNGRKWYRVNGVDVDPFNILHIPAVMYPGADVGYAPVEAARQSIGSGLAAQEYAARFLDQDSTPGGVIEVPTDMPPEKTREMARSWARKHAGKNKTGLPGVLVGGATWKQTAVTNEQAQFLESRGFTAAEIAAQMFLIDPADLGIGVQGTSLTYANLTERNLRRVQVTFLPWIVRLERALSSLLPPGEYVKFNVNGLLRGDMKTRFETYKVGRDIEAIQVDEIREWEELSPLPERAAQPPALVDQIEAVGQLIRAGFEPDSALAFLGLPPIKHTGLVPITVTPEQQRAAQKIVERDEHGLVTRIVEQ